MASPLRVAVLGFIFGMFCYGVYDVLTNIESNGCEMTYMYENPEYMKIDLSPAVRANFPNYHLYLYGEGEYASESRSSNFKLRGIPVLFIPGNAGSYRQVRSLGSVSLRLGLSLRHNFHFNFFTLDLNEELTGLFGALLYDQTEFAHICLRHILSMYSHLPEAKRPSTVVIVGHSMGGLIARALFTRPDFDPKTVNTIITQATPHRLPVIAADHFFVDFYNRVNNYWRYNGSKNHENVLVVSTGGGYRDILVRDGLTNLDEISNHENTLSLSTMSAPNAWVSTDHLCHVWCRQVVLASCRAMYDMVDKNTKQVAVNPAVRKKVFQHHLQKNPGVKQYQASFDLMVPVDEFGRWETLKKRSWRLSLASVDRNRYTAVAVPRVTGKKYEFVAISNVATNGWVGVCSLPEKATRCKEVGNFAYRGNMIPPYKSGLKVVHLDWDRLDAFSHAVVMMPKTAAQVYAAAELYQVAKRFVTYNVTSFVEFFVNFPNRLWSRQIIINATRPRAIFYNVSLRGLDIPLQAFTMHIDCIRCNDSVATDGNENTVVKFHVPWSDQHTYTLIPRNTNGSLSLKLQSGRPDEQTSSPSVQFYLMPLCTYQISISISWSELFGQFVRYYGLYLPAFLAIQVLMVMSWQLMILDEKGEVPSFLESHTRWAQPYRVGVVAMGIRLMFNYPEDDNIATLIGLPADDLSTLQKENIWYQALPVLLYLVAYSFTGLFGHVIQLYFAVVGRIAGPIYRCFSSSSSLAKLMRVLQYFILIIGCVGAGYFCGTIGLVATCLVFSHKTMASYVSALAKSSDASNATNSKVWNRFNMNVTLNVLFIMLLALNAPPFITWIRNLSIDNLSLVLDPSRSTGVVACLAALMLTYVDMSLMFHELTSVMGAVAYICCVLLVLFGSVSVYRISHFVNATLMTVALPSFLIAIRRTSPQVDAGDKAKTD